MYTTKQTMDDIVTKTNLQICVNLIKHHYEFTDICFFIIHLWHYSPIMFGYFDIYFFYYVRPLKVT